MSITPGPWRLQEIVNPDARRGYDYTLDGYRVKSDGLDVAECVFATSDALAIAALPEMRETLLALTNERGCLIGCDYDPPYKITHVTLCYKLRATLDKMEGG